MGRNNRLEKEDFVRTFVFIVVLFCLPTFGKSFDLYFLSLTWPISFCNVRIESCKRPVPQDFTIHGLWPGFWNGKTHENCQSPIVFDKKLVASLRRDLEGYWPDLLKPKYEKTDSHFEFWDKQRVKHGSCSAMQPKMYFDAAIRLRKASNLLKVLRSSGIVPGTKLYTPEEIKIAIENGWGVTPLVKCNKDKRDLQLLEIVIW
ncbi:intracellular ribonuclease LX-like [Rhododendron vialii]|uniref:intracellular ribonuclease LX-like n=1 Tax=Rhododendron vialii TaxID=182163 RepID=UPI00265F359D|nr:intracellular ribonuclease LX-like [Rhododendron vialii]